MESMIGKNKNILGVLTSVTLPILLWLSIKANLTMDARVYQRSIGLILAACIFFMCKWKRICLKNDVMVAFFTTGIMTTVAYLVPSVNTNGSNIVPNALYMLIALCIISSCEWDYNSKNFGLGLKLVTIIIFATALYGIYGFCRDDFEFKTMSYRLFSVYTNPIPAGSVFLVGFCLFGLFENGIISFCGRVVCLISVIMTMSRSTILGLVVAIIISLVSHKDDYIGKFKSQKKGIKRLVISVLLLTVLTASAVAVIIFQYRNRSMDPVNIRLAHWKYTIYTFFHQDTLWILFGHGYYSSSGMIADVSDVGHDVIDNAFLTILYENGVVAILVLVRIIIDAMRRIVRSPEEDNVSWICAMTVLSLVIPSCFYEIQWWNSPITLAIFCMAPFMVREKSQEFLEGK